MLKLTIITEKGERFTIARVRTFDDVWNYTPKEGCVLAVDRIPGRLDTLAPRLAAKAAQQQLDLRA